MRGDKERRGGGIKRKVQTNMSSEERRRAKEGGKGGKEIRQRMRAEQRISVYQFYYCVFIHE